MNPALVIAARDRRGLSPTQRHVLLVMATHAEKFHPTVQQLADGTGLCVRSIQRALQGMEDAGAVRAMNAKDGSQGAVRYAFILEGGDRESGGGDSVSRPPDRESPTSKVSKKDSIAGAIEGEALPPAPPAVAAPVPDQATGRKATRWPDGQPVPDDWIGDGYALRKKAGLPEIDLDLEAANFTDHWTAKSGKDAVRRDWHATWRKWVRTSYQKTPGTENSNGSRNRNGKTDKPSLFATLYLKSHGLGGG